MVHHTIPLDDAPVVEDAPAPRPARPAAVRLRLEPTASLPRHAAAITDLARRCRQPNPFFLPAFLGPAIEALGRGAVQLALVGDSSGRLIFFAPVACAGIEGSLFSAARVWSHPFAPLGLPLIDMARAEEAAAALLEGLDRIARGLLVLPDLPLDTPELSALRRQAEARGHLCLTAAVDKRPVLRADRPGGAQAFRAMVSRKKRKELARQLRRLSDIGPVSFASYRRAEEIATAMEAFLVVEAAGWKGRRGTAMAQDPALTRLAVGAVAGLARRGAVAIDAMSVGDRPAAALVRFQAGGLSIPWKIAYDETFAPYSPGAQLMSHATRAWLADPAVSRVDPVCEADNALLAQLWDERETYATLIIATGPRRVAPRLAAGMADLRHAARRVVRHALAAVPFRRSHGRRT